MINRRHIRLKVLQSLYAFFTSKNKDVAMAGDEMIKHVKTISELHAILLSLPIFLSQFANAFLDKQKHKHLPTDADKNPNFKFVNNQLIKIISKEKGIIKQMNTFSEFLTNNYHDFIRKLFLMIWKSDIYNQYLNSEESSFDEDKEFILSMFKKYIIEDKLLHHILGEKSIFWIDDLPFVANIVYSQFKTIRLTYETRLITPIFKNTDDKTFAIALFHKTITNNKEFDSIIINTSKNWDLDRIALMDQILLKMGLCELLFFERIPIKVTLNEYIEVAKYYSTTKSKSFINGILDKTISEFKKSGKIVKVGRGLIE
tara:strand:- start:52 stop:996 length:945 start_codon:yes stop_codon:yes gene_type:complete